MENNDKEGFVIVVERGYVKTKMNSRKKAINQIPFNLQEAVDTGCFGYGPSQLGKSTLFKWLVQIILEHGHTVYVLDASKPWSENTPIPNIVTVPHKDIDNNITPTGLTVLDLSDLSFVDRFRFLNAFSDELYN